MPKTITTIIIMIIIALSALFLVVKTVDYLKNRPPSLKEWEEIMKDPERNQQIKVPEKVEFAEKILGKYKSYIITRDKFYEITDISQPHTNIKGLPSKPIICTTAWMGIPNVGTTYFQNISSKNFIDIASRLPEDYGVVGICYHS